MPPDRLLARYAGCRKIVELASGPRFEHALRVATELPGCVVVVTDIDPRVLYAPPPLCGERDDLLQPRLEVYKGAALLYAVRLPEELHHAATSLAGKVGADLALSLAGDEAPALVRAADEVIGDREGSWYVWRTRT